VPHITIEYSRNVTETNDIEQLVDAVHQTVVDLAIAKLTGIRTRAVERSIHRVADGDPRYGFIAVRIHMAPGRSDQIKRALLEAVADAVDRAAPPSDRCIAAVSVEITEIDPVFRLNRNHIRTHLDEAAP